MKDLPDNENIFSISDHLTKEQLVQYHLGQMLKSDRYAVERHLVDCELCKDALSGMALMPGYKGIDNIRKDIRKIMRPKSGLMNQVAWRNTIIAAAVLSLLIFATLIYIYFASSSKISTAPKPPALQEHEQSMPAAVPGDSASMKENIKEAEGSSDLPAPSPIANNATDNHGKESPVEPIKPRSVMHVAENFQRNENINMRKLPFATLYIADLKTVDYSQRGASNTYMMNKFKTGIRSQFKDFADQNDAMKEKARETKVITYEEFLEDALVNFKKKNYEDAIEKLQMIQSYFLHDLNAKFYLGLCYYYTGRWNQAWANFAVAGNDQNITFKEESDWYRALTEIKQNKLPEAKQHLSEIIDEDGFYKEQAKKKVGELK